MNMLNQTKPQIFWYLSCSVAFKIPTYVYVTITVALFVSCGGRKTSPCTCIQCCYQLYIPLKAVEHDTYICVNIELRSNRCLFTWTVIYTSITAHEQAKSNRACKFRYFDICRFWWLSMFLLHVFNYRNPVEYDHQRNVLQAITRLAHKYKCNFMALFKNHITSWSSIFFYHLFFLWTIPVY
jgi:hypothetical protein